jgi:hypothetical protein
MLINLESVHAGVGLGGGGGGGGGGGRHSMLSPKCHGSADLHWYVPAFFVKQFSLERKKHFVTLIIFLSQSFNYSYTVKLCYDNNGLNEFTFYNEEKYIYSFKLQVIRVHRL